MTIVGGAAAQSLTKNKGSRQDRSAQSQGCGGGGRGRLCCEEVLMVDEILGVEGNSDAGSCCL